MDTYRCLLGALASFVQRIVREPLLREIPGRVAPGVVCWNHSVNYLIRLSDRFQARPNPVADLAQILNVKAVDLGCVAA